MYKVHTQQKVEYIQLYAVIFCNCGHIKKKKKTFNHWYTIMQP